MIAYTKGHESRHGTRIYIFEDTIRRTRKEAWAEWAKDFDLKTRQQLARSHGAKAIKIRILPILPGVQVI